jgi:hypothetical protein
MASKYKQVGVIWKGKENKNGELMADTLEFSENFVPTPGAWYQIHTKKFKQDDLERKVKMGWLDDEKADKARYTIGKMSDKIRAEIIEIIKE